MIINYERLAQLVHDKSGLTLDRSRIPDIDDLCAKLLTSANLQNMDELFNLLEEFPSSHDLWQPILQRVTIGETYFFRNAAHFNALQMEILPSLIRQRREQGFLYLNIWSAGCSTGEEPYSIAMLLQDLLPDISDWTITILGSDVNQDSIEYAKRGRYRSNSFRSETRQDIKQRFFTEDNGTFILDESIRKRVSFNTLNLISDDFPNFATRTMHQDIIICRNVTIYFNEQDTQQAVHKFYQSLTEDGWLIVGHAEPSASTYQDFETYNFPNTIVYRKPVTEQIIFNEFPAKSLPIVNSYPSPQTEILPQISSKKAEPEPIQVDIAQIQSAVDRGDWDIALSLLAVLENQTPMNPEIHYLRGLVLMNSGSLDEARQSLRRSLYCDPTFALAYYAMGDVYSQQGNMKQAKKCWLLSDRAVAGLEDSIMLADDLTVGMFRDLIALHLNVSQETIS